MAYPPIPLISFDFGTPTAATAAVRNPYSWSEARRASSPGATSKQGFGSGRRVLPHQRPVAKAPVVELIDAPDLEALR
jgi:hypothetical protein